MKKPFILASFLLCLIVAACYDDDLENINGRLDAIENNQIASLKNQVKAIENTLPGLENADKELKGYITSLQATAVKLQEEITATEGKTAELEEALKKAIENAEASNDALL